MGGSDETRGDEPSEGLAAELRQARQRIAELEAAERRRRQVEQELRDSREQYRTLVEGTDQPITYCQLDGTIAFINPVGARNLGAKPSALVGRSVFELLPDIAERTKRRIAAIHRSERGQSYEDWIDLPAGSHCFESRFEPIRSAAGVVVGVQIVSLDVTPRKRAEAAQHESEALWRTLTESSPDFVMLVDLDGRIRLVNRAIAELSVDQIIGTHHLDFLRGKSHSAAEACFAQVLDTKQAGAYRVEYPTGANQSRHFDTRVGPVIRDGEVTSFVVTATDITERHEAEAERARLEAQVLHSQKLESLGLLAGGIAHDFNNLLMGVIGNAELVHQALPRYSATRERIGTVVHTAKRCADLAQQMLAYSGKSTLAREPIDLRLLLVDMRELLQASMADQTVFEVDLAEGLPVVEADASQLHQVVMNLVINAAEAIGDAKGVVSLSLAPGRCEQDCSCRQAFPEAKEWPAGRCVVLTVSDTGCGMDGETRSRLFDPFFTTKVTGRGLGLAVVHGILRGHKAGIVVESQPAKGSAFRVHFPAAEVGSFAAVIPPSKAGAATGTILVIDDEPLVRDVVAATLEHLGFAVLTAADGLEGVEVFRAQGDEVRCIILDVKMPRMGGAEALVELRKIRPHVPVLLTSGYPEEDAAGRFAGSGLAGFIQKPFSIVALEEKVTAILEGGTGWSTAPPEPDRS